MSLIVISAVAAPVQAIPGADAPGADAPGIAWFKGDVDAAFAAAAATHRQVFLYWGAKWCPPCMQLKSSVFSRSDFIEKSKLFVAVYLDGDEPRAQRWGQVFEVTGYPTVVILRPDRKEITRIADGMDLGLYADLLDIALSDAKPMSEVLAALRTPTAALSKTDCQRLAYYAWDLKEYSDAEMKTMSAELTHAAAACAEISPAERARLVIAASRLDPDSGPTGKVLQIVADRVTAVKIVDALAGLDDPFFGSVKKLPGDAVAQFQRDWAAVMQSAADDPAATDADRLGAIGARIAMIKAFAADGKLPKSLADEARARISVVLARPVHPYVRAGTVNVAAYIYSQLGDPDAEIDLFKRELAGSKTPYYYMADLAGVEEARGNKLQALDWYERAYRDSHGVATRFQWGGSYVSALLRLTPADTARIRAAARQAIAELDGAERIQARSRLGLERLDVRLRKWNDTPARNAVIESLRTQMQGICRKLPPADGGLAACRKFLSAS